MICVSSQSHLHLLEFVDRKGLPAELKRLQAASKAGIGIGVLPPSEQATSSGQGGQCEGSEYPRARSCLAVKGIEPPDQGLTYVFGGYLSAGCSPISHEFCQPRIGKWMADQAAQN